LEFVEHRKTKKNPMSELAATKNLNVLETLRAEGQDPRSVIDQSIANGWTGLFEVKGGKNTLKAQGLAQARPVSAAEKTQALLAVEAQQPRRVM
jgi:hypothetical protein